jgi:hypothetical protein
VGRPEESSGTSVLDRQRTGSLRENKSILEVEIEPDCQDVSRQQQGGLAQLAARMLSMHKVAGSIPAISTLLLFDVCWASYFQLFVVSVKLSVSRRGEGREVACFFDRRICGRFKACFALQEETERGGTSLASLDLVSS